ncbi:ferritin, heavy subunit-like [Sorex araneus]|uniref:ferritin, heavy subunit-like n=1 Tax=Sorex araneus TaxID=42254 RepID=UPI0024334FCC|nr:ferritin, heavy subunit-like [Sorex araneus]
MASRLSLSEECRLALNNLASFELNVSDAYLSLALRYTDDAQIPPYIPFFEDQVEVKKEHARQFVRFLKSYRAKVSLPVIKRPDKQIWETGLEAVQTALDLEKQLDFLLQDLDTVAGRSGDTPVKDFLRVFFLKQKKNLSYLEHQVSYQKELKESGREEAEEQLPPCTLSKKPARRSRKKT